MVIVYLLYRDFLGTQHAIGAGMQTSLVWNGTMVNPNLDLILVTIDVQSSSAKMRCINNSVSPRSYPKGLVEFENNK